MMEEMQFKKNFIWNIVGTSFNAFNSLFFMVIVTRINGLTDSGIFTLSFSLACLFCIIGGYEGRVFQVTDVHQEFNDKEYIVHRLITTGMMIGIAFCYAAVMEYDVYKLTIMISLCLMKGLEVVADVFYGILQKNGELYKVGYSLTVKSIFSVILFFSVNMITNNLIFSCMSLVIIWLLILLTYDIPKSLKFLNKEETISVKNVALLFKSGFFSFAILFLSMYLINAPKYALDGRVAEDLQAIFGIILMPATVISLCAQYLLQPFLSKMSLYYKNNDKVSFQKVVRLIFVIIGIIGVIALLGCYLIGIPILNFIYSVSLDKYLICLLLIIFGAVFYSMGTLFSTALTTIRKTFIQFLIYIITSIFGFSISVILINQYGIIGASYSYLLIMLLQFILYLICYTIIMKKVVFKNNIGGHHEN